MRIASAYGAAVVALRHVLVLLWLVLAAAAYLTMPGPGEARSAALGSLVPADAAALDVHRRSAQLFRFPVLSNTVVVQRDEEGLSAATQARVVERARAIAEREYPELLSVPFALPVTNALGLFPGAPEENTTALTFLYYEPGLGLSARTRLANWFMDVRVDHEDDALVGKTGIVPARIEQSRVIRDALPRVQLGTVILIALVIGLTFRGLAAPLVMLGAVGIAFQVALRLVAWGAETAGLAVPQEAEPVMLVLLLGLVANYSIFLLAGLRHRLHEGEARLDAARGAATDTGPIVFIAGVIVAAAAGALFVAELEFFRVFGPALALAVVCGLAVALTFVPAALALLGRFTYWPGRVGAPAATASAAAPSAGRLAARSRAWSAVVSGACVAALLVAASGVLRLELALTPIDSLPQDREPAVAARAAQAGFGPGILSPTLVLVEGEGIRGQREGLTRLQERLDALPWVAGVIGPANVPGDAPLGLVVSERADAARYLLLLDLPPLGSEAIDRLSALRAQLPWMLLGAGLDGAQASVGGNTALAEETIDTILDDLVRISVAVLAVVLVLLILFLRSLVAPLYLLAAGVLAMAATLGLTVYAVELLFGRTDITYYVPFMAAVLLVALGSDYNILLVGRVWQEARERPLPEAIALAAPRASRTIGVAAIALASSFALLALVPLWSFREFALAMVIGVCVDAFVVRTFLVPALLRLFGETSRWPSRLGTSPAAR